ncbi:MAG: hypothetical protein Q4B26_09405 [Eubacteriales bacterium]|nr:hypothetical protein [Eubacteriales bacterium]
MKVFTAFIKKIKEKKATSFGWQVFGFYLLLMVLYLYFMMANLSSAPTFVYSQF